MPAADAFADSRPRVTRQRTAVAAVVDQLDGFTSAQDIRDLLKRDDVNIGLSTVYRTLHLLAESGAVDAVRAPDGEMLYRSCGDKHHHHLVCRDCGKAVELAARTIEAWVAATAAEHGYEAVSHEIEIFGRCPSCAAMS